MIRKSIRLIILLPIFLTGVLGLVSCSQETLTGGQPETSKRETVVTLAMQVPGAVHPATRGLDESDEYEVRSVEVLVFDQGGDFRYIAYADDISEAAGHIRSFTVTLVTGTFDLMILANSREWIELNFGGSLPEGTSRTEIEENLIVFTSGKWQHNASSAQTDYKPIPMWGEKKNVTITANSSFTGADRIRMTRMLARIDVSVEEGLQPDFKLKEVYLYNPYSQGLIIPGSDPAIWDPDAGKATAPTLTDGWNHTGDYVQYETVEMSQPDVAFERVIYTFEAPAGTSTGYTENTFLVVGGEYKGEPGYYRIDFVKTESGSAGYLPLLRNHLYDVRIKQISNKGFATHALAARALPMNIKVDISQMDEGRLSHFVYDDQYYLGTDVEAVACWSVSTTSQIIVGTDFPAGWTFTVTDSPDGNGATPTWISFTKTTGSDNRDILYYSVEENPGPADRTAYIHLTAGRLTQIIPITQHIYGIHSVTVLPDGDIPGGGGNYTFTINGSFDDTEIRIRDVAQNDHSLVSGVVGAHTTSGSRVLTIPLFAVNDTRTLAFEYYDFAAELWRIIRTGDQHGFEVTSSLTPEGAIITAGETFDVYVNGRNYPDIYLRAVNEKGIVVSGSLTNMIYGGSLAGQGGITVEENTGATRRVTLQWSTDQINWRSIVTGVQSEYDFTIYSDHTKGLAVTPTGKSIGVYLSGNFPAITVKVFIDDVPLAAETTIPGGYATTENPTKGTIAVPNNPLAATRTISIRYSDDEGNTWRELTYGSQSTGNYQLSTGRIMAISNAKSNGRTGEEQMTWAEAMGIELLYNTSLFSATPVMNYEISTTTGCAGYYEQDDMADRGKWRLPTMNEMQEIKPIIELNNPQNTVIWFWINGELATGNITLAVLYPVYDSIQLAVAVVNKTSLTNSNNKAGYVRCLRQPD